MLRYVIMVFSAMVALSCLSHTASAASPYRHCIRISFPGKDLGTMTNLCNKNLYAIWVDDRGEHDSAIGKNASVSIGRVRGPFQIKDAILQNDGSASPSSNKLDSMSNSGTNPRSNGEVCRISGNKCMATCETTFPGQENQCLNACTSKSVSCMQTGHAIPAQLGVNTLRGNGSVRLVASKPSVGPTADQLWQCSGLMGANPVLCVGGRAYLCLSHRFSQNQGDTARACSN